VRRSGEYTRPLMARLRGGTRAATIRGQATSPSIRPEREKAGPDELMGGYTLREGSPAGVDGLRI